MTSDNTSLSYRAGTQAKRDNASEILITGSGGEVPFSNSSALLTLQGAKTQGLPWLRQTSRLGSKDQLTQVQYARRSKPEAFTAGNFTLLIQHPDSKYE